MKNPYQQLVIDFLNEPDSPLMEAMLKHFPLDEKIVKDMASRGSIKVDVRPNDIVYSFQSAPILTVWFSIKGRFDDFPEIKQRDGYAYEILKNSLSDYFES
jgi:hypothetical protein